MIQKLLYVFIPISIALDLFGAGDLWIFLTSALAIVPLATAIRDGATEVAEHTGQALGGLITVTFANATELILSILLLLAGNDLGLIKATISGSIISNSLLGLGLAIVLGVRKSERLAFDSQRAGLMTSMLRLSILALILPALFDFTERTLRGVSNPGPVDRSFSVAVSVVLVIAYFANVIYTVVTRNGSLGNAEAVKVSTKSAAERTALWKALALLLVATIGVALESDLVSRSVEAAALAVHLTPFFVGITVLPLVGNAAEYFTAVHFAKANRIDLTLSIAIGSSIQIALLTAPVLMIFSYLTGHGLSLVFENPLELFAIFAAGATVNSIAQDGEVVWFEGVLLLAVYVLLSASFFYLTP